MTNKSNAEFVVNKDDCVAGTFPDICEFRLINVSLQFARVILSNGVQCLYCDPIRIFYSLRVIFMASPIKLDDSSISGRDLVVG